MLLALTTGHAVGLAVVAGAFVVFAFVSALVIPRRWPDFPGRNLRWFIVATLALFVSTLAAVEFFAREPKEARAAETTASQPGTTTQATQPPAPKAQPAAGKGVFLDQGCGNCHTFVPAASSGTVGPNLSDALKGKDSAFIRESITDPNKVIAKGYTPNVMPQNFGQTLTPKQLDDLVAFLSSG